MGKCRSIQGAASADVNVLAEKAGKHDVVLPIAFPDEGTFGWLDGFLAKNPDYVEISDRKILEWAKSSGLSTRPLAVKNSNDKPEFNFDLPGMDDKSIRKVLLNNIPHVPRNYVIMEVKSNLIAAERKEILDRFPKSSFNRVARIVMGEPDEDYKQAQQQGLLKDKQVKSDAEWKKKKEES